MPKKNSKSVAQKMFLVGKAKSAERKERRALKHARREALKALAEERINAASAPNP